MTTAIDIYGPPLLRALLREGCEPESIEAFRVLMYNEGATFRIAEIAGEVGVPLPQSPERALTGRPTVRGKRRVA